MVAKKRKLEKESKIDSEINAIQKKIYKKFVNRSKIDSSPKIGVKPEESNPTNVAFNMTIPDVKGAGKITLFKLNDLNICHSPS